MGLLVGHTPLVGRQRELDRLLDRMNEARRGALGVVLVEGEPGQGKTRLLVEMAARARTDGATVLHGGASDAEGMPPYLLFLEALGGYIRASDPALLREQAGADAAILAAVLPELGERLVDAPPAAPLPAEQSRLRLYEAVGRFLGAIAATTPVLLVLDDLHWADPSTLDLLCAIARRQAGARLLVLGAYRGGEVHLNPALERALAELTRLRVLDTFTLGPLGSAEIAALAAALLDAPLAPDAARLLLAKSEGNPFFAEELLRAWQEQQVLTLEHGRWRPAEAVAADPGLSTSISATIQSRLDRLPPDTVEVLRIAAVAGRTFDLQLLAVVAGRDAEQIEEQLYPAIRAHLLLAEPTATLTFRHDRVRECLYAGVPVTRRMRLHAAIGTVLEGQMQGDGTRRPADLAYHFTRAGDRDRGAAYAIDAGSAALAAYAPDEALVHFRAARNLLQPDDSRCGAVLDQAGQAALLAGREREAAAAFRQAQALHEQAGQQTAAARSAHAAATAFWRREEHEPARAAFLSALTLLDGGAAGTHDGERDRALARLLVDLASFTGMSLGQLDEGQAYAARAVALAAITGDPAIETAALRAAGNLLMRCNDLPKGIPLLERALAMALESGDAAEAGECFAHLGLVTMWLARTERARALIEGWIRTIEHSRDTYQLRHVYVLRAALSCSTGDWTEGEQYVEIARPHVEAVNSPEPAAFLRVLRGQLAWGRGDYERAEQQLSEAIAIFRSIGPSVMIWYLGILGVAQMSLGKRDLVRACAEELDALITTYPSGAMPTAEPLTHLSVMALWLGDKEQIARCYVRLHSFRGQMHDFLADRLLGQMALALGDLPAARSFLASAEETARREGLSPELARALAARADLALAERRPRNSSAARALLEQALALMTDLQMQGEASALRRRLGTLDTGGPVLPDGLSGREAEVLRLIASGRTNREIAEDLVLSVRTVERHIANIYSKTNARGRADATRYAVRHGLTVAEP